MCAETSKTSRPAFDGKYDFIYRHLIQLSMRTDYALRALFTLVEHYGGQPIPIIELSSLRSLSRTGLLKGWRRRRGTPANLDFRAMRLCSAHVRRLRILLASSC